MDDNLHGLLNKLRLIASIKPGQKLDTSKPNVDIYQSGWISWIRRKINGDDKDASIRYLTSLYRQVHQELKKIQDKKSKELFQNVIVSSCDGLINLKNTYRGFSLTQISLQGIIDDFADPALKLVTPQIIMIHKRKIQPAESNLDFESDISE